MSFHFALSTRQAGPACPLAGGPQVGRAASRGLQCKSACPLLSLAALPVSMLKPRVPARGDHPRVWSQGDTVNGGHRSSSPFQCCRHLGAQSPLLLPVALPNSRPLGVSISPLGKLTVGLDSWFLNCWGRGLLRIGHLGITRPEHEAGSEVAEVHMGDLSRHIPKTSVPSASPFCEPPWLHLVFPGVQGVCLS